MGPIGLCRSDFFYEKFTYMALKTSEKLWKFD